ncbi:DUF6286 domain-containing Asp23/Gls24 family envelope stress response protein [Streptomyces sp. NPDC050509]|uniref:DUF6286 domain-containing Asp23/Gls24 family envelope stress response protein n=1 Tax=Streptomyces sp. NPDC050509 TaxID=3365620 RepID=UPI0037A9047D
MTAAAEPAERGTTRVADRVVRRIAGRAAAQALGPGGEVLRVSAEAKGGGSWRLRLDVALAYPVRLETAGARLQEEVSARTAELTGLKIGPAEVRISRLDPSRGTGVPGPRTEADAAAGEAGAPRRRSRRPWSERRVPAAVLAAGGAALCGLLLADLVAVALGGTAAGARTRLLEWVSEQAAGGTAVTVGGVVAVVAGLWLLLAGLTPGLRGRLAMTDAADGTRAALDRSAVGALVHHGAAEVPGVSRVRVRVGRGATAVRATVGFGDLDEARKGVARAVAEVVDRLGPARPPRIRVRVSPDAHWRAPGSGTARLPVTEAAAGEPSDTAPTAPSERGKENADAPAA